MIEMALSILIATIVAGTPIVYAALGELVTERSGVLNLGVEGMMLCGAVSAFAAAMMTGSVWVGIGAGALVGAGLAFLFGVLAITFKASQVAVGLALAIFGTGLSSFIGKKYVGQAIVLEPSVLNIWAGKLPWVGGVLGQLHPLVWLSWGLLGVISCFLYRTQAGLVLRAVGESPRSAHALGYKVGRVRYVATLFGGAMAGVGGAYVSLVYTSLWTEGLVAGRGWIAVGLVVFATWRPVRCLLGAYLFGGVTTTQLFAQGAGTRVPTELLSALPYLATILVLVLISRDSRLIRLNVPASLGKPFHAES
jgi:general nucleoside transport system permease protein